MYKTNRLTLAVATAVGTVEAKVATTHAKKHFFIIFDCTTDNPSLLHRLTWPWLFLIGFTMACVSYLIAVRLNHLPYEVPDHPGDEGDDDLDKAHNKPQDVHHQEKHHLEGIKSP